MDIYTKRSSLVDAHSLVFTLETALVFHMVEHCPAFGLHESKKRHASPGAQAPSSEFAQSTWKVDWDLSTLEPVHHLVSPPQGCGQWAPTPTTKCKMAVLRHCIIHSGYLLSSGEVIPSWRSCPSVHTGDCLGLPHGGTLSSIWTLGPSVFQEAPCESRCPGTQLWIRPEHLKSCLGP